MSLVADICEAVVGEINDANWSLVFTAVRKYRPEFTLAELATLRVTVVPAAREISAESRSQTSETVDINVAVQKVVDPDSNAEIDELLTLCEDIGDLFRLKRLDRYAAAIWQETANSPIYDPKHLLEKHVFTGLLKLTFKIVR
jgi:hypothetical protein